MCGICGFAGRELGGWELQAGQSMCDALVHRGPDGDGSCVLQGPAGEPACWLGHRRLKVLDVTEAAHQPMLSPDGRVAITYNGEIYNFAELRRELEQAGHSFVSSGDTEVVLHAYLRWGEQFAARLQGMFAVAVWDGARGRLLLARDRSGKKPLFYSQTKDRLTFASEIKALLRAPWIPAIPDERRLGEYLSFGYVPNPRTFYRGIEQLPPGCTVSFGLDGLEPVQRYWDALPEEGTRLTSTGGAVPGDIRALVEQATRSRLVSDVPLGALLSGGVDSSIIVGLMAGMTEDPVRTFSIGFEGDSSFDERSYARLVSERFATKHTEFVVSPDAVSLLDRLVWLHDGPFGDASAIPTYIVCQLAREHVTVVLNGDGGDEVFAGYDRFLAAALSERIPHAASTLGRRAARLLPVNPGYYSTRRRLERFLELAGSDPRDRYHSWVAVMNEDLIRDLLGNVPEQALESTRACYERAAHLPLLDQILYVNFKTYLSDDLCVKMDRMSMAHSLEARSPFLDTAIVDYVSRIPAAQKIGWRRVKPLLRHAFWPLLPKEIWNRRKHGFGVPLGPWFRSGALRELFEDEVLASQARCSAYLDPKVLAALWQRHQDGQGEYGAPLWVLLTLERWLRSVETSAASSSPAQLNL